MVPADPKKADSVLAEIDTLLSWKSETEKAAEGKMVRLSLLLLEAKRGAYWICRGYQDEDEWIRKAFPQSRAQYYRLLTIAENLANYPHDMLERIGLSKCGEIVRIKRHFGYVPETLMVQAENEGRDQFQARVKQILTGQASLTAEKDECHFISFKLYGDAIATVHEALRIAGIKSGSDKSAGDMIDLICIDFLSGYSDDGSGHLQDRNGFLFPLVGRLIDQMDLKRDGAANRLVSMVVTRVEREKDDGAQIQDTPPEALP